MADANKPWQFQKGVSGNPKGRPRKGKSFSDILETELKKQKRTLLNKETGETIEIGGKVALCRAYISLAFTADNESVRASCIEKIMKFIDGDFVQRVDMSAKATVSGGSLDMVKARLDMLSQEERMDFLDLCEKMNYGGCDVK